MAVYTDVLDEEMVAFLATYDIGDLLSYKGIAEGVENSNYLLRTTSGSFILTLYEKRVRESDLPFFIQLLEYLSKRGLSCPLPVQNRNGDALGRLAGRPAAIVTFLDGIAIRRPGAQHCLALGQALAEFHVAGKGFALQRPNALSLKAWPLLFDQAEGRADEITVGLDARIRKELAFLGDAWPTALPTGTIHADLFPDNVFFIGEKISGLIDFYFACTDALAYDLAICVSAWCFEADGSFNLTKGSAMLHGYQTVRQLSDLEAQAFPILCRGASLRFLLTRLVDFLNVPPGALVRPKDPLEYDRKLAFHRHASHARDYGWQR